MRALAPARRNPTRWRRRVRRERATNGLPRCPLLLVFSVSAVCACGRIADIGAAMQRLLAPDLGRRFLRPDTSNFALGPILPGARQEKAAMENMPRARADCSFNH